MHMLAVIAAIWAYASRQRDYSGELRAQVDSLTSELAELQQRTDAYAEKLEKYLESRM
jgi:uncharacterized protein YukE